jgi:hypothetical protein
MCEKLFRRLGELGSVARDAGRHKIADNMIAPASERGHMVNMHGAERDRRGAIEAHATCLGEHVRSANPYSVRGTGLCPSEHPVASSGFGVEGAGSTLVLSHGIWASDSGSFGCNNLGGANLAARVIAFAFSGQSRLSIRQVAQSLAFFNFVRIGALVRGDGGSNGLGLLRIIRLDILRRALLALILKSIAMLRASMEKLGRSWFFQATFYTDFHEHNILCDFLRFKRRKQAT